MKKCFENSWFYWIHLMILEKMRSCFRKLKLKFWTYGLMFLLGPIGPNVVSRPQTPTSRYFLRFHSFIGFISWFFRKWSPVLKIEAGLLDLWLGMLHPIGANVVSRPQTPRYLLFYWTHLMILEKRSSCFWIRFLGPIGPNVVSRSHTQGSRSFFR